MSDRRPLSLFSTGEIAALVRAALDRIDARHNRLSPTVQANIADEEATWNTHLATLRRRCSSCGQTYQASTCPHCAARSAARPTHLW